MATASAQYHQLEYSPVVPTPVRAFRPFGPDVVDLICVEEQSDEVRPRIHHRFAIVLLRSLSVVRLESSRSIVANRNTVLLVPPGHVHGVRRLNRATPRDDHSAVTLLIDPSRIAGLADADRPALVTDADACDKFAALVTHLQRPVRPIECETSIRSILEDLVARSVPVVATENRFARQTLVAVRDYLREHETDPAPTEALSRFSGLTESHLIRAFHHEFGLPPHAYHLRLRLARACDLLAQRLPVSSVAYECGFADQSHLSRKFKETYGLTPASWANAVAEPRHTEMYSSR
jgi:AraC-like DNA-binding protein